MCRHTFPRSSLLATRTTSVALPVSGHGEPKRIPAALEETGATPQHHDAGQHRLGPSTDRVPRLGRMHVEGMRHHRQQEHRDGQHHQGPELARHGLQFAAVIVVGAAASSAPAPCRTWGSRPAPAAGFPDASGRCTWRSSARRAVPAPDPASGRARPRISRGSRPSRNGRCALRARPLCFGASGSVRMPHTGSMRPFSISRWRPLARMASGSSRNLSLQPSPQKK